MKRSLLIAGGTVGGLGAVLAVTPPQFTSSSTEMALPSAPASSTPTPSATATQAATPKASATLSATATVKKKSSTKTATTKTTTATPKTTTATPTPAATTAAPATSAASGTFTGKAVSMQYGTVQVKITVSNGKITDAQAIQAPTGRNDRWTQMSVPVLRQQTLAAQSAKIQGVSGASYTSYGWYTSLVSALSQAGL